MENKLNLGYLALQISGGTRMFSPVAVGVNGHFLFNGMLRLLMTFTILDYAEDFKHAACKPRCNKRKSHAECCWCCENVCV